MSKTKTFIFSASLFFIVCLTPAYGEQEKTSSPPLPQQQSKPQEKAADNWVQEWIAEICRKESFIPPIWSNWALVAAAIVAAFIGLRTLRAINRQIQVATDGVEASRIAAAAALENAKATVIAQRAYINASPVPPNQDGIIHIKIRVVF